ncbi:thermonuclease family protein [Fodinicurvata sp. EGI_FJ10296]|uniref:thermonuclease family protein n=1 Tax=Fodinicurvata sp. EGI_FJ10296 TaxID=3231908 RepID=UPI0034525CFB
MMPILVVGILAAAWLAQSGLEWSGNLGTKARDVAAQTDQDGARSPGTADLACYQPDIVDGDTFGCDGQRVRLVGIDAPEMPGHCRPGRRCVAGDPRAATSYLSSITRTRVECTSEGTDRYGRTLGRCEADGVDLSCAMLEADHAERRYGFIIC